MTVGHFTQTRFENFAILHVAPSLWRFVHRDDASEKFEMKNTVGPCYKTKMEALADLQRYAVNDWGYL